MMKLSSLFSSSLLFLLALFWMLCGFTSYSSYFQYYFVGTSSLFLSHFDYNYFLIALKILALLIISFTEHKHILLIHSFWIHLSTKGNDFLFILPLLLSLSSKNRIIRTLTFLFISISRQILIEPNPSVGMLWLLNSHQITEFQQNTRYIIIFFQSFLIFISRYTKMDIFPVAAFVIFDPTVDFSLISILLLVSFNLYQKAVDKSSFCISFSFLFLGLIFNQSSFFAWFKMGIGNPNFTMVGSIIFTIGAAILMMFSEKEEKVKKE